MEEIMKKFIYLLVSLLITQSSLAQSKVKASNSHKKHPAVYAADGDFTTYWASTKKGAQTLTFDLEKVQPIKGFVYIPFLSNISGRVLNYELETSLNGNEWINVAKGKFKSPDSVSVWTDNKDEIGRIKLKNPVNAQFYRLKILSTINDKPARFCELQPIIDKEIYENETMATLKGQRYAPSIHLNYKPSPKAQLYYNEIEVTESVPGSFFMAIGFNQGYFGIQETNHGKKWFLFSIWDSKSHDKNAQLKDKQVQIIHQDPKTRAQRFGGEGSGGQSFYDYNWKVGEKVKFALKIEDKGERRHYSSYIYLSHEKRWVHMLTFASIAPQAHLSRFHSFVEDFKRDYKSFHKHRGMKVFNSWVKDLDGKWHYITDARFTRDANPHTNITAYSEADSFYFGTGGKVKNEVKPGFIIKRPELKTPPTDLPF